MSAAGWGRAVMLEDAEQQSSFSKKILVCVEKSWCTLKALGIGLNCPCAWWC